MHIGVGKSCLLLRYTDDKFKKDHAVTVGIEYSSKLINIKGNTIKLKMWDTAGAEEFKSMTRGYYTGSCGALCIYDITSRSSFTNIETWIKEYREYVGDKPSLCLVGNKADLTGK